MHRIRITWWAASAFLMFLAVSARSQDNLKAQLFGETDQVLAQAKEKNADLYAPVSFGKAMEYYRDAEGDYKKGSKIEDIREKLKNAAAYLSKAIDACKLAEVAFISTMTARNDAMSAGAPTSTSELWRRGEEQFGRAARELEDGDVNAAKKDGAEAVTTYRAAELEAIQANYLTPARQLLVKDDALGIRDDAPVTLEKAKRLAHDVEALLKQNRYDRDSARVLARQAKVEAGHALTLAQHIRQMKREDKSFEDALLEGESHLQRVISALGLQSDFENGSDTPVNEAIAEIKLREARSDKDADSLRALGDVVRQRESEIDNLKQQIASMQSRVGSLTDAEKDLQRKLSAQHDQEETVARVSAMFTEDEGKILRDGKALVIRLYGLSFPVGKSDIQPQYYTLLSKVQDAIKRFPNCKVTIEGHTDSQGSDEMNQALSNSRAKAVAEYLMANMNVEIPINSQGYGESRPVASNDTPEGRAMNRRIDVVITPAWAAGDQ